ncbi:MAG: hypothetical protein JWM12_159 [Ilumatobacteraceae bacterium]|nr:hypothetical protein [Ilumatobacteraceae bacterium]
MGPVRLIREEHEMSQARRCLHGYAQHCMIMQVMHQSETMHQGRAAGR